MVKDKKALVSELTKLILGSKNMIDIFNEFAVNANWFDSELFRNDEETLDEVLSSKRPSEVVLMIHNGEYRYADDYFLINSEQNLDSYNVPKVKAFMEPILKSDFLPYFIDDLRDGTTNFEDWNFQDARIEKFLQNEVMTVESESTKNFDDFLNGRKGKK